MQSLDKRIALLENKRIADAHLCRVVIVHPGETHDDAIKRARLAAGATGMFKVVLVPAKDKRD